VQVLLDHGIVPDIDSGAPKALQLSRISNQGTLELLTKWLEARKSNAAAATTEAAPVDEALPAPRDEM